MPEGHEDRSAGGRPERRPAGELEASVLAALWAADGPLTPIAVQLALGTDLARTTVTTILTRLHAKGTVTRNHTGRGYAYAPAQDPPGLTARRMHAELNKDAHRDTALARFVADLGPQDKELLRTLLDEGHDDGAAHGGTTIRT
ncbi:BlaI/MecI/CopY family transcriptional regulator [Streptomyces asoensis]|uniref:BlaI/MecI/CopY family transcriptional regulator n=1 Tax=Streptomyces asoensis TaxID=249586 RepID=A0A6M4WGT1_9ACTN|nr:BlaI/MecI/CopY family transcriptional regulator [Streptomyces asoensis]QJS99388.1 BlaI/MecI/CopY family transcriptional regulator [Streptomyces asoensis]